MEALVAAGLWGGALLGVLAVIVAVRRPARRRVALLLAALSFLPIGVLGILSVGAVFLAAAVVCLASAALVAPSRSAPPA